MDVELPDGTVVEGVPDGLSQRDLVSMLAKNGHDTSWYKEPKTGLIDRVKSALTPDPDREPMPQVSDTINAGWTSPPSDAIILPGSVMDGYTPAVNDQGMPIEAGMGPMRKDYHDATRAGLISRPIQEHAAIAQGGGQVGKIAAAALPGRVDNLERDLAGDTVPRTSQDLADAANASLTAQPLRSEATKEANRQWLTENSAGAIESIKRFTNMGQGDAEAELAQMIKYGVKPPWVDGTMPEATLAQAASANIGATGPALQKALLGLSEAAADQPFLQLPWQDYAKRTPRELEAMVGDLDKQIRTARNVGGKIEAGSWNDVVSSMGPSLAVNLPPLIAASLVAARNPAAGMAIANGGLGVMGLQAFGDAYLKGQAKGLSAADNLAQASLTLAAEVIPEKLSLNALFAVFKTMGKGAAVETVKAFAKQQLTEHSTEQITTIADHLIDKAYTEPDKPLESLWAEMKQTGMATAIQAPLLAGGGIMAHGAGRAIVGAQQRLADGQDLTAGREFDPGQIDAAARQALDPANAQMQRTGLIAAPEVPRAQPADILAAPDIDTAIAAAVDSVAAVTEAADALPAAELIEESPVSPQPSVQTPAPVIPVTAQPEPVAAGPLDDFLSQGEDGRWKLSRPIANQAPEVVSAIIDEMDRRNQEGSQNAATPAEAQQSRAALPNLPQAAPEAGALPDQLSAPPPQPAPVPDAAAQDQGADRGAVKIGAGITPQPNSPSTGESPVAQPGGTTPKVGAGGAAIASLQAEKQAALDGRHDARQRMKDAKTDLERADAQNDLDGVYEASQRLDAAVTDEVQKRADSGEMAVFKGGNLTYAVHPATDGANAWQVTTYNDTGALGDTRYKTLTQAIKDSRVSSHELLDAKAAAAEMDRLAKAEGEYQARKNAPAALTQAKAITRTKAGKLEIAGFTREDITESLKTAKIKATVAVGQDGRVLVSAVGRTGNFMPMPIKQSKAIETALMGKTARAPKPRKFTGNLRNDVNLIAPGLYAEVARGGDGEAMDLDMSLVAEQLKAEGFMLPTTETGKDSDAVIELIRQDIANGGGTLNEARQTKAMTEAELKAHRADVLRLADEYGIQVKRGAIPRALTDIEAELKVAIEQEIGVAGKAMSTAYDAAIAAGIPQAEADAILDRIDDFYQSEASPDRWVMQYREQANALQEAIDGYQEREGRDQEGEGAGDNLPQGAGSEGRPGFELAGQTEAGLRAEQERVAAAEAQRLKDEQAAENKRKADAERGAFNLTGSDRPADTLSAQGQGGLFDAPAAESKPDRGEVGASLTKEQRKAVMQTLTDVYKTKGAPKESKGLDQNGNERIGYAYSPELFEKSDITGAPIRYVVTLPDGRIAHPTELFPDMTLSKVEALILEQAAKERDKAEQDKFRREQLERRKSDTLNEANGKFNRANPGLGLEFVPALLTDGKQFIRTHPDSVANDLRLLGGDWAEKPLGVAVESKTIAEASLGDLLRAAADKADGKVASEGGKPVATKEVEAKLKAIAERMGIQVIDAGQGFHAGGNEIYIPDADVDSQGVVSRVKVFAHELGHAAMQKRGISYKGFPVAELRKQVANWDDLVSASKAYRPEVHNHENDRFRRHAMKPNEIIADAIASVLTGTSDFALLKNIPIMRHEIGLDAKDEGKETPASLPSEAAKERGVDAGVDTATGKDSLQVATSPAEIIKEVAKARPFDKFEDVRDAALAAVRERTGKLASEYDEMRGSMMNDPINEAIHDGQYEGKRAYAATLPVRISESGISTEEARTAFMGTSHSPEKRGASARRGLFLDLVNLWRQFEPAYNAAPEDRQASFREAFEDAAARYTSLTRAYLSAHGRVMSSMITGPARFPVESNRKKSDAADKRAQEASEYLGKARTRLLKVLRGRIDNSLAAQLAEAETKLAARETAQARMKAVNSAHAKFQKDAASLDKSDLSDADKELIRTHKPRYSWEPHPFAPYELSNNNAEIRRMKDRVEELKRRAEAAEAEPDEGTPAADGVRVVRNAEAGRLQLFFDEKPSEEIRNDLKANGFKWAPSQSAWQRQLTANAEAAANQVIARHFQPKETDKGVALESRNAATITGETPATIRAGLSRSLGKATVDRLEQSGLLRILDTAESLPDDLTISSTGTALYDGKTAYIIADRTKPAEAIRAALHEIGEHHGLEGMLGEKGYKALGNRVRFMEKAGNARVKEAFAFVRSAYPELREDSPVFMKEILANIGQDADVRAKPWWKEMIAAVRRFLVKLGYGGLIRTVDIEDMVLHSLKTAARGDQFAGAGNMIEAMASKVGADATAFKAVDTESANFRNWFGDSVVTDNGKPMSEGGRPLRVYHGTYRDFNQFQKSDGGTFGDGIYFARDPDEASIYAGMEPSDTEGRVLPVYLSIKNPASEDLAAEIESKFGGGTSRELARMGYDGIFAGDTIVAFDIAQIKSAISNTGAFSATNPSILESRQAALPNTGATPPAPPTRQTPMNLQGGAPGNRASWNGYEPSKLDDVIRTLQDKQIDSKRTVQAIKAAGRQVADKWDVYLQETLFHGRAAKRTLEFVETELNPLATDLAMRGLTMAQLEEFLHARHAEEANALIADRNPDMPDGGSGMTNQQAQDYFAKLDPAMRRKLEAVAKRVDTIIANTRKLYVSYGLESQETVDGWADTFNHYVPLMREDKDGGMGIGQGFSIKGKETKSRTGSTRTVVDILANIAMQRERAIVRGEKNRVATALMGLAKLNPNPDFWTFDKVPHEQVFNPKTGLVEDRPDPMFKTRDNVVVAKIADGKGGVQERAVVFAEDNEQAMHMARALKNLDAAQLEGLIGATAKLTRYFASVNTQYNPIFGVTNLVRDVQDAMLNLTSTPIAGHKADVLKHTLGALRGIYIDTRQMRKGQPATSAYAQLWEEFQHEGGQTGYRDMFRTSADRAHAIEKMIDPHGWTDSPLGKVFTAGGLLKVPMTKAQDIAGPLFDWLSDYNEAMENAVRLAAYKVGKEQGMSNQQAAAMAKGLTVNFNRKGQIGIQAGAIYAFFNASMQGTGRIAETLFTIQGNDAKTIRLSSVGQKIVAGGILLGSMQALMLAAMGFGDDEPPEFVRERNTIIPIGDKKYITIPMPLGFAILPNIGRVSTEFVLGGFKSPAKHVARLMGIMADAFNPVGGNGTILQIISPTALDPAVALAENKDWTKKPIAKVSFDKTTPGHKLWKDTASTPSKWIAEAINTMSGGTKHVAGAVSPTPDQIDYLFGQVTGGVGREAVKIEQTVMSAATGEDLPPHKIPLVGRFYGDAEAQSSQASTFYSNINRINEYEAEVKGLRKERKGGEASKFIAENPEARLVMRANHVEREVQKLRKEKHDLIEKGATRGRVKIVETRIKTEMEKFNRAVEASKQRQK